MVEESGKIRLVQIAMLAKIAKWLTLIGGNNMNVTATELKNRLGQYLDTAQVEPVIIEKSGRESNVVISKRHYDELCELEDKFWDIKAQLAEREGFISDKEMQSLLGR